MNWIKVIDRNSMPKDRQFLAVWEGTIHLTEYDEKLNQFRIGCSRFQNDGFSLVSHETEEKFTYWMPLPELANE